VNPREVAQKIIDNLPPCDLIDKVRVSVLIILIFALLIEMNI